MALPHAHPLDIIDVTALGPQLSRSVSTSLIKTDRLQLLHLVLAAHQDMPQHHVADECVIQCLEGDVEVTMSGGVRRLGPGQLVLLPAGEEHGLRARASSAVLLTLILDRGDAGHGGGAEARSLQERGSTPRSS